MKNRVALFKSTVKMKMALSRPGNILTMTMKKPRNDYQNFSRKEWKDGRYKKEELMLPKPKLLRNASTSWYI